MAQMTQHEKEGNNMNEQEAKDLMTAMSNDLGSAPDNGTESLIRHKLIKMFEALTSNGWIAKPDFWCCNTCASHAIGEMVLHSTVAYVFWNCQDDICLRESGSVYLKYAGNIITDQEAGNVLTEQLDGLRLCYDWDGDPGHAILVNGNPDSA